MRVIQHARDLAAGGKSVCSAIGMFDGVHLGHQRVLQQTVQDAHEFGGVSVAITFDVHPNSVVAPERAPRLIYSLPQRLRAIDAVGVDTVLLIHFDKAFSQQSGEAFIQGLAADFQSLRSVSIGSNFTFGHKRSGNVALLKRLGHTLGFQVHEVPAVSHDGIKVSSTRIREAIERGKLDGASVMLGRPYAISGWVVEGQRLGRQLGFPTANIDVSRLAIPPRGVYAGRTLVEGRGYAAVANIGVRPTLNRPEPRLHFEIHLLDFAGDVYGQELEFKFVQALRPEEKFKSLEELKAQISKDVLAARNALG